MNNNDLEQKVVREKYSPQFKDQLAEEQKIEDLINEMVGDIERILTYPSKGFQIYQEVPQPVLQAFIQLKAAGYIEHCQ